MRKLVLALMLFSIGAQAQDRPTFQVDVTAIVRYPDGTKVTLKSGKKLTIEGFDCEVDFDSSPGNPLFWGPTVTCAAPGVGVVATVSRCDTSVPGYSDSATLQLHNDKSPVDELYTQVTVGCETTYTRLQRASPKKKTSGA
jgi:hypothetical protein